MILVVSPNPALDRVAVVRYRPRSTLRPERFFVWPGGSGVHAGAVARTLGAEVFVVGFAGGPTGATLDEQLRARGIGSAWTPIAGETRQTLSLIDIDDGNLCDVVEPGPRVDLGEARAMESTALDRLGTASLIVISGSLPLGCPALMPARLVRAARSAGLKVIADLQGSVLESTVAEAPWMIKPSLEEVAHHLGHGPSGTELATLCERWLAHGVVHVCVSMGERGLLWLSRGGYRLLTAPRARPFNTIGCGDALVGATAAMLDHDADVVSALRAGVAAATANLAHDAPGHCEPGEVATLSRLVDIRELDRADLTNLVRSTG